ncbi:hypothetical protein AVEN_12155-1 [Araneus ventricosus]|uniref:Speckle-type POZ protein n=1 Tax=Araneus ventricosus TaxID=182803 RepID=A0A4Y2LPG6_ARAVE|nr:hypothetical protein AVEN_12155-1 [Araneus ventricosus]
MDNFEITWQIQNFHFCWHKTGEWLESPLFKIDLSDKTFWRLQLYPRGEDDGEYISCYLFREEGGPEVVDFDFELFLNVGSLAISEMLLKKCSFKIHQREGHSRLASRCQIFAPKAAQTETFVVRFGCRIFNRERDDFENLYITMLTRIEIERFHGTEIFDDDKDFDPDCNKDIEVKPMLEDEPLMNINLSYVEESLVIKIRPVSCKNIKYAICKMTVIQNWGKESPIEYVRSWIGEIKTDIWRYRVLPPEAESSKQDCKTSTYKAFFLRYDFAFSTGEMVAKCGSEYYTYVTTQHFPLQQYFNGSIKIAKSAPTAMDSLEEVYRSRSFVDFDFKSETETFPAHKAILCARSPILKSIVNLNCIGAELIPLEDYIGKQLILFLYTDTVEFLSLWTAGELYSIAAFLKVELLKTKCRNFLRDKLDLHHVVEILRIVCSIEDFPLKSAVENFIVTHYDLVLHSINWETLRHEPELRREIILLKYKKQKTIQMVWR